MKIALVSTHDLKGGAAIAAHRLYQGLKQLNHDTAMMVRYKHSNDPSIHIAQEETTEFNSENVIFQNIQEKFVCTNRTELSNTWFSIPYPGYDLSKTPLIKNSQVINLHWVAEFQSVETIANLLNLGKPVVWTLHDENPYTGGCHYSAGCTKYRTNCRNCLQLKENRVQLPGHILENKIKHWPKNLTIVTPSKWLAECTKKSRVFKEFRIEVIPNSLETDIFKPKAKNLAKKKIGIAPRSLTLLFGAHSSKEKRKGFEKLLKAMKYCWQNNNFKKLAQEGGIRFLTFGPPQEELAEFSIEIKSMGYINDKEKLATIYSAADIFILPSLEDNLPNTMLEAMACGTPVIGFEVGGLPDMIQNNVTGFMSPGFDYKKLAESILKLTFDASTRKQMSLNCRHLIDKKFKLQDQAEKYLDLFKDLRKQKKMISKERKLKPHEWEPITQPYFFNLYRKEALALIDKKQEQIPIQFNPIRKKEEQLANVNEQLCPDCHFLYQKDQKILYLFDQLSQKDARIKKIHESYSYRIGHFFLFPLKMLNKWKTMKKVKERKNVVL